MVLHSWAGAANKSTMATVVSGSFDEPTVESYAAREGILRLLDCNLAIDCPTDHAKSSHATASLTSRDGVVSSKPY